MNEEPAYAHPSIDTYINVQLEPGANCPTRGTIDAGGYDLYSLEDTYIGPNSKIVSTGVRIEIPTGYVGIIKSRSSMACKSNIYTEAGVIDSDYRGIIGVCMYQNNIIEREDRIRGQCYREISMADYHVKKGDKIAQLLIVPVLQWKIRQVSTLNNTVRGEGGYGSTGR
jgi:dUTP pyrophosphatase